jgi:hypothetical protein
VLSLFATFLVFGLAFVVLPFGSSWYEIPKVILSWIGVGVAAAVFFWNPGHIRRISHSKAALALVVLLFFLTFHSLLFRNTPVTLFGNAFRLQGVLTMWALLIWSVVSPYIVTLKHRYQWAFVALLVLTATTLFGISDNAGRAVGVLGGANSLGAFAVFLFPFAAKKNIYIPLALASLTIFLSGSRSALIGLIAAVCILLLTPRIGIKKSTIIAIIILLSSLALPLFGTRQSFDDRVAIWQTALQAGYEKPLLGWGVGNIEVGLKTAAESIQTSVRFQYVDSSHNMFLDWWVQAGIVGLVLFISKLFLTLRGMIREKDTVLLASLFGMIAVMLFNPVSIAVLVPFWWLIGEGIKE